VTTLYIQNQSYLALYETYSKAHSAPFQCPLECARVFVVSTL